MPELRKQPVVMVRRTAGSRSMARVSRKGMDALGATARCEAGSRPPRRTSSITTVTRVKLEVMRQAVA